MTTDPASRIPRNRADDYTPEAAAERRAFIEARTEARLDHVGRYAFDPKSLPGNIENFIGAAQVPIGLAGPLRINGERAQGEFYIPMATTEGTLVASYNRGMRLITECGGAKATVVARSMQRSPVFLFEDALEAREFGAWVDAHFEAIKAAAETTTRSGKLVSIQQFAVGPTRHLRFNFTTGDAAGQNMSGKATAAACEWIRANRPGGARYILSGNTDTDKKHSQMNMLATRGRRVVAEAVLGKEALKRMMRVDPRDLFYARQVSQAGAFLAGSANNGAHAANGLAAMFIATGQDAANVAESHAAIVYAQLLEDGDYYWSITLPALIVATVGGGTGLATQSECLAMLGCQGSGKADKLAEICAAVALAGDISLSCAILSGDWVSSHERLGRNRPP
ncbi:hydroxymethylglutaryl-CoA reductase [Roseiarcus sp.]|uniref:hydroxymethylglutaryl-CoA reductase n=1 Tax=Roseiarcus sp. TaxID=1969460 RepID=UPI003F9AFCA3